MCAFCHLLWAICLVSCGVFSSLVSPIAKTVLPSGSMVVNSCSSTAEQLCNFICDCSDCSDENQCGYMRGSAVLGTPFTCDFEDGDCGWQDMSTSTYRWVRGRANLALWGTGPYSDHTVGTDLGWFLVTVSPPAKTTATAWLRSPELREAAATCEIRAWYHVSGSCEGTQGLNETEQPVLHLDVAYGDEVVGLWQSPRRSSEGWHQLVAYLGRVTGQFQLIFSLTQPPACGSEVALDDIIFRNCGLPEPGQQVCGAKETSCSRGSCLAWHRFCDGTDDCGDNSDENVTQCKSFTNCSFEHNLCDWTAAAGPALWDRNTSLILGTSYSIPTRDHSTNSRTGFFLHVSSASSVEASGTAQLVSPSFQATNSCSLVLYCHIHGSATSSLSISYVINSAKHLVKERTGDLGSCWVRERVNFSVTQTFKVLIEGVAGSGGTVAIDDLILSPGCVKEEGKAPVMLPSRAGASRCTAQQVACDNGDCIAAEQACDFADTCPDGSDEKRCGATTFESGGGGWHDVSVGRLRWGLQRLTEPNTFLTGTFLALQVGEGQMVSAAKAQTPLLGPSGPTCTMEMSYHIHSGPQGFLAISIVDHATGTTQLAWHTQGRGGTAGGRVRVPLGERSRPFQVELLALVDLQGLASIGIDNVTFEQCYIDVVSPTSAELTCNFERDMCGWYQDQSSDFKWVRSMGQGQGSDHTTGLGYFLSVDPSVPWSRGQRAQLITSRQDPAAAPRCLSFWYRLAGPQIGTLNLKLQPQGEEEVVLWTCRGTQGSIWHQAWATLPATGQKSYRVAFEVLRDGFLGDVGLDDLALTAGPCRAELSCSFEAEGCGLAASGQGTWQRQSNSSGTAAGPAADHTTGTATGHYMVVSTGRGSLPAGHTAVLTSQPYQPSMPAQCLTFWYQLSSGAPGSLGVFVKQSGVRTKVLSVSTMEGSSWHRGHITVWPDEDWQAVFEAVGAGGDHGYIALDDLQVSDGICPEPVSCDFEQGMCGWSSPLDPHLHSFAWVWKSGVPLAKYPSPEQDHTLGTRNACWVQGAPVPCWRASPCLPPPTPACGFGITWTSQSTSPAGSCGCCCTAQRVSAQCGVWRDTTAGAGRAPWCLCRAPVSSRSHFPPQIIFELTTRRWPLEGTVALDDILYSAGMGCHSSLEEPGKDKPSGSFIAEVVLGLLLALIIVTLMVTGGWYWLKQRGPVSRTSAESDTPQSFDNITFRDDKVIISSVPREGNEP
ncbi:apical endosomal glycoprotein isoform X2 [Pithys albifrons albifrons]|uniref:apical endosomal glycoprotein isoform X2 n=1 Tax=Pithys albifrons albifrons TaxID=3385563 RepID=UPI003A5D0684